MLNDDQLNRLVPFFTRVNRRQRLIIYLAATGFSVPDLVSMTVQMLLSLELPDTIQPYRDEVIDQLPDSSADKPCFVYSPSGKAFVHTDFYRVIRNAPVKVLKRELSRQQLIEYVQNGTIPHS